MFVILALISNKKCGDLNPTKRPRQVLSPNVYEIRRAAQVRDSYLESHVVEERVNSK